MPREAADATRAGEDCVGVGARARARAPGGCARDAVEERTGVAMEEESAGEDGVAAAATPSPKSARGTRGGGSSFSAFSALVGAAAGRGALPRLTKTRAFSSFEARVGGLLATMDVIGLTGLATGFGVEAAALGGVGLPLAFVACAPPALDASAHMDATAVTRPPRPPRADLTLYFIST